MSMIQTASLNGKTAVSKDRILAPTVIVIFGAGGDLTWRKLIPALYNLFLDERMPDQLAIIGIDHKEMSKEAFCQRLMQGVNRFSRRGKADEASWTSLAAHIAAYLSRDFSEAGTYTELAGLLTAQDKAWGTKAQHIFYLATPPSLVETITSHLGNAGLAHDRARSRIVVEKPFGRSLDTAVALNTTLTGVFQESQLYRIDHYLGKETVQNILAFRFANALFEPIWDRRYIDHIQIMVAEQVGVEHRGGYYDKTGALRDMIQNHLLQILCLVAMEPPVSFDANEIRNKKLDVLRAIRPIPVQSVDHFAVRGQYGAGWIEGKQVCAYQEEPGVDDHSLTETYAALKLYVDNWRWQDVPFYLRTGKRLSSTISEVAIQFRPVPHQSFPTSAAINWQPNSLLIGIQPAEEILLRFQAKQPGTVMRLGNAGMRFRYQEAFQSALPEAYETLLLDVILGDATLFMRADQVEAAWAVVQPVMDAWEAVPPTDFPNYSAGSWGPEAAEALVARDRRSWLSHPALQE